MIAKLIVEGKEFSIEIQDPELQKMLASPKKTGYERVPKKTGYERVSEGQMYWLQDMYDGAIWDTEPVCRNENNDDYDCANYYSDKTVAENNARADKLMRQLRRFAVEHRKSELDWSITAQNKYYICYDRRDSKFDIDYVLAYKNFGAIYFDTKEVAEAALSTFKDELTWYFTGYKDSL